MSDRARMALGAAAVVLLALVALAATALGANHSESTLTSARNATAADRNNAYYACLSAQAHSLIGPKDVVYMPRPTLGQWATVIKVIGGWAHETLDLHAANVALSLQRSTESHGCNGDVMVVIIRLPDGHLIIKRGS